MLNIYKRNTLVLIFFSTIIRVFWASQLEFGNDEVYYWLYAKYPDISHFDHPPMVGFLIQFFSINLFFDSELAIRLAAIIPSSISMYVIYLIGDFLKDEKTGFTSVLLYNLSIYGVIISGTFILPDAPMVLFWLLGFYFLLRTLTNQPRKENYGYFILAFIFLALAIYSKYQAIYLLFGVLLYVVFYNNAWLKTSIFYAVFICPLLAILLIFYWNYSNNFISFNFHSNRVSLFSFDFNSTSFIREILGQFLYSNPYIFVAVIILIFAIIKGKYNLEKKQYTFFLCCTIPLILTTIYISLFRDTLPHWSGIGYITLIPLISIRISEVKNSLKNLVISIISFWILVSFVAFEINNGLILTPQKSADSKNIGKNDPTLDMFGWKQLSEKLATVLKDKKMRQLPIISEKWYPAAHIDYYIGKKYQMKVYGMGELNEIHKYYWITKKLPKIQNSDVLFLTDSRNFKDPNNLFKGQFEQEILIKIIPIERNKQLVKNIFMYQLTNFRQNKFQQKQLE